MSEEETQFKISMPLIDDIELQRIDTFYNDIVSEYTKAFVKEKEQVITQRLMMNLQQENKQLKEQIKEIEEYINDFIKHGSYGNDDVDNAIKQEFHNIMLIIKYAKAKGSDK